METFKALLHHVTLPSWLTCLGVGENISLARLPAFRQLLFLLLKEDGFFRTVTGAQNSNWNW